MVKDVGWKDFFSDNSRYADIINGIGCNGKQVVTKKDLQETDTQVGMKYRDCVRKVAFGVNFAIVGIENQDEIDYSLPIRGMSYDVGVYEKQVATIRKHVRKKSKDLDAGEYLYGFRKDDKVYPVITFVLYAGSEEWNGATSLHEIVDFESLPEGLKEMVSDYRVNLINIRQFQDTSVFRTDVKQVFDFLRCANDKDSLKQLIENDTYYQNMDEDAFNVAVKYTKAKELIGVEQYYKEEGGVNMCKALTELIEEGREEGREEGVLVTKKVFRHYLAGKSHEEIAEMCELAVSEVAEILA